MGNPLLELHRCSGGASTYRDAAVHRFGFAVPTGEALAAIERAAPSGVVELGAGTGYWAQQLADRGVDVVAYDLAPAPSSANKWFAGSQPWFPVQVGDEEILDHFADRCLLLVWPTRNESWAAAAVRRFHEADGRTVVYVGERPGGRTGDDVFHALIGELDICYRCAYGVVDLACVCDVPALFRAVERVVIPTWEGFDDHLLVLRGTERAAGCSGRRRRVLGRMR